MKLKSKCWVNDHWINFDLMLGTYDNIITFLNAQKLSFLSEIHLDFSNIPLELHGKGNSINLLQYLANNTDDNALISRFLEYFLNMTLDMRYVSGKKIDFLFPEDSSWQNFTVSILNPYTTTTSTTTLAPIISGESVMFIFKEDNIFKYKINNFTEDIITDKLSFDLDSNIWYIDQYISVTDKGFIEIFYDDDNTYKIFIINLNGTVIYQKDITNYYNYEFINKYATIQYEENGKYYFLVYDGSVRTFEFDNYIYLDSNFDDYLAGGIIIFEENVNYFYLIKDESNEVIFLREQTVDVYLSCNIYEYSNLITFFVYDSSTNYLLSTEIYDITGVKILDYSLSDVSSSLNGIYYFTYFNESDDFLLTSYDDSLKYIFYYSYLSNTISYKTIDNTYDINLYYNEKTYSNIENYYSNNQLVLLTKNYISSTNNIYYYDSVFMLPLFEGDTTIGDFYEFTSGATSGWTNNIRLSNDYINIIIDSGNINYDILVFSKFGTTINSTNILKTDYISNNYYLYDRNILITNTGDTFTTHIIMDGIQISGFTFNVNINYNIWFSRNTFVFSQSGGTTFYTNTHTGNQFYYLNEYYDSYQTSDFSTNDNLRDGKIFLFNYETELGRMISDYSISDKVSIRLIENSFLSKYDINIGRDYFSIQQAVNQDSGIPYTHTQLSYSGPVDPLNYIMNGQVLSGDTFFGSGSSYFTNLYPGLFVMISENISIGGFKIVGNLGADGGGNLDYYQYYITGGTYSTDYTIFVKRVYDATDPSVNHIIIVNNNGSGITHTIGSSTDNDLDSIYGLSGVTRIDYLLTAKIGGEMLTNEEVSEIVTQYLTIVDNKDINESLSLLNSGYTKITSGITNIYNFTDSNSTNDQISDGGDDMYDGGNAILPILNYQNPFVVQISYFDLSGNTIDSIYSTNYDIYVNTYFGNRYFGYYNTEYYVFNGLNISIVNTTDNDESQINNWFWWND